MPQLSPEDIYESMLVAVGQPLPVLHEPPLYRDDPQNPVREEEGRNLAGMVRLLNKTREEISEVRDNILTAIQEQVVLGDFLRVNDRGHLIVHPVTQVLELKDKLSGMLGMSYNMKKGPCLSVSLLRENGFTQSGWTITVKGNYVQIQQDDLLLGANWFMRNAGCLEGIQGAEKIINYSIFYSRGKHAAGIAGDTWLHPIRDLGSGPLLDYSTLPGVRNSWQWDSSIGYAEGGKWAPYRVTHEGRGNFKKLQETGLQDMSSWLKSIFTKK